MSLGKLVKVDLRKYWSECTYYCSWFRHHKSYHRNPNVGRPNCNTNSRYYSSAIRFVGWFLNLQDLQGKELGKNYFFGSVHCGDYIKY